MSDLKEVSVAATKMKPIIVAPPTAPATTVPPPPPVMDFAFLKNEDERRLKYQSDVEDRMFLHDKRQAQLRYVCSVTLLDI